MKNQSKVILEDCFTNKTGVQTFSTFIINEVLHTWGIFVASKTIELSQMYPPKIRSGVPTGGHFHYKMNFMYGTMFCHQNVASTSEVYMIKGLSTTTF